MDLAGITGGMDCVRIEHAQVATLLDELVIKFHLVVSPLGVAGECFRIVSWPKIGLGQEYCGVSKRRYPIK